MPMVDMLVFGVGSAFFGKKRGRVGEADPRLVHRALMLGYNDNLDKIIKKAK